MQEMFLPRAGWVLSGSALGWRGLEDGFDLVVFLYAAPEIRAARIRAREARRFGEEAVAPGGWRHSETQAFIEWASQYDSGEAEGRSLTRHEALLAKLTCPVLRLRAEAPIEDLTQRALVALV